MGDETHRPTDRPAASHVPVFADRVVRLLAPTLTGTHPVVVDATLGLGGHALALLRAHPHLHIVGLDRDAQALTLATERIAAAGFGDRLSPVHAVYDRLEVLPGVVAGLGGASDEVDAILFDLGVSSMQLDRPDRGFSYSVDAPLDMRMDQTDGPTAADIINTYAERDLARILRDYGEERFAARIARAVVARRRTRPFATSGQLVEVLRESIPVAARRTGGHPAKRTFQALRIEVNDELGALQRAVPAALDRLRVGGRLVVLAYQSLEDRIVKRAIAPLTMSTTPPDLPVELPGHEPVFRWLTRGAERPGSEELTANPRASSARLRAAERLRRIGQDRRQQ